MSRARRGWRAAALAGAAFVLLGASFWTATPWPHPPSQTERAHHAESLRAGCFDIVVWSNDVHTSLSLPAALLPPDHPLRQPFAGARHFLIGWGEAAFYRSDGTDVALAVAALVPPSPSVVHVLASDTPPETWFRPVRAVRVGISAAGAAGLADYLSRAVQRDPSGAAIVVADGQVPGASQFFAGRDGFHALRVCNHWTADALAAAGLPIRSRFAWSAAAVTRQVAALSACPPPPRALSSR